MAAVKLFQHAHDLLRLSKNAMRLQMRSARALATTSGFTQEPGSRACFRCGEEGHSEHLCPTNPPKLDSELLDQAHTKAGPEAFTAMANDDRGWGMPQIERSDTPNLRQKTCGLCGRQGHIAKDCPWRPRTPFQGKCKACGATGHRTRACPSRLALRATAFCRGCGQFGHYERECTQAHCKACGGSGHTARFCQKALEDRRRTYSERSDPATTKCYACGKRGHWGSRCFTHSNRVSPARPQRPPEKRSEWGVPAINRERPLRRP